MFTVNQRISPNTVSVNVFTYFSSSLNKMQNQSYFLLMDIYRQRKYPNSFLPRVVWSCCTHLTFLLQVYVSISSFFFRICNNVKEAEDSLFYRFYIYTLCSSYLPILPMILREFVWTLEICSSVLWPRYDMRLSLLQSHQLLRQTKNLMTSMKYRGLASVPATGKNYHGNSDGTLLVNTTGACLES